MTEFIIRQDPLVTRNNAMIDKIENDRLEITAPHVESLGSGPAVICFHCSTSSSKQWQPLMKYLCEKYEVFALDLYGYGKTPAWSGDRKLTLKDEAALVEPVISGHDCPFTLIGHSYGGAVAMTAAMMFPERIKALVLYEPVLFNLLFEDKEAFESVTEALSVERKVNGLIMANRRDEASRVFVDYWSGEGTFDQMPEWQQAAIVKRIEKVISDFDAAFRNQCFLSDYKNLTSPTMLLYGMNSPISTRRITHLLATAIPNSEIRGIMGQGHMAPIICSNEINGTIGKFLQAIDRT